MKVEIRRGRRLLVDGSQVGTVEFSRTRTGRLLRVTIGGDLSRYRLWRGEVFRDAGDNHETQVARRRSVWRETWDTTAAPAYVVRSRDWLSLRKPLVLRGDARIGRVGTEFWRGRRIYSGSEIPVDDALLLVWLGFVAHAAPRWWDFAG